MKKTIALLIASSSLTATLGVAAGAVTPAGNGMPATLSQDAPMAHGLVLVDDDGDDDEGWFFSRRGHDDDDDDCGEDDDDRGRYRESGEDDDDDGGCGPRAAPAGTVAPPQNGLFENGTMPQAQTN